jgi:hypothetical protein
MSIEKGERVGIFVWNVKMIANCEKRFPSLVATGKRSQFFRVRWFFCLILF